MATTWTEWAQDVTGQITEGVSNLQVTVTKTVNDYMNGNEDEEVDNALAEYYKKTHGEVPEFAKKKVSADELASSRTRTVDRKHRKKESSSRSKVRDGSSRDGSSRSRNSPSKSSSGRSRSESRPESSRKKKDDSSSSSRSRSKTKEERPSRSSSKDTEEREKLVGNLKRKYYQE